ncbi:hypothetical protein Tco_0330967 [Tanacetum coccineum]
MVKDKQGTPVATDVAEFSQRMTDFVMTVRQDTFRETTTPTYTFTYFITTYEIFHLRGFRADYGLVGSFWIMRLARPERQRQDTYEIYGRLDDTQDDRLLMSGQLNMLRRDRSAHARTTRLMETEARLSREACVQSMMQSKHPHRRTAIQIIMDALRPSTAEIPKDPKSNLQDIIERGFANPLMQHVTLREAEMAKTVPNTCHGFKGGQAPLLSENKRKQDDNQQQQHNKRQNTSTAGSGEKKPYEGSKPLCSKCNYHHDGQCAPKCHKVHVIKPTCYDKSEPRTFQEGLSKVENHQPIVGPTEGAIRQRIYKAQFLNLGSSGLFVQEEDDPFRNVLDYQEIEQVLMVITSFEYGTQSTLPTDDIHNIDNGPNESAVEGEYSLELHTLLKEFGDVFDEPIELPPKRSCDHRIPLKDDTAVVNISYLDQRLPKNPHLVLRLLQVVFD